MARKINLQKQRGFSLIEALFSAVVLGIALLALAGFHAVAMQDSSLIKARSIAANLAQEKLDDLRSFSRILDDASIDENADGNLTNDCGAETFCFSEIADDAGGQENADGTLVLGSGTVSGYIDNYSRAWEVTCSPATAGAALSFTTTCDATTLAKLVTVTISWTDSKGADQEVSFQGVIYAMDPSRIVRAAVGPVSTEAPKVDYTPAADSIPIEIGGGKSTETSKPLPEVSGGDSRTVILPSVVYTGAAGNEELVSREEFATVNCTCTLQALGTGWTPHRTVWNGYTLEQEYGEEVTKPVGVPNPTGQSELCNECCRDHHDTNADAAPDTSGTQYYPLYRPYLDPSADFDGTTGDHKHYKADNSVAAVGEDYVEACRMKRIDGFWRVVPDWLLVDLAAIGCDYFVDTATNECPPSATENMTKLEGYRDRVRDVLQEFVSYLNTNKTVDTSTTALLMPDFTNTVAPLLDTSNSAHDIEVINGGSKQLLARGIYADVVFMPQDSGTPRTVDQDYVDAIYGIYSSDDFEKLQYLPFYDANLTLLANWSPTSIDTAGASDYGDCSKASPDYGGVTPTPAVCVTNEAISTIDDAATNYYDDYYSRGKIIGKLSSGETLITASVARGNNGLTASPPIDGGADTPLTAQVKAKIPTSSTSVGITGTLVRGNSGADLSKVSWTPNPATGVSCAFNSPSAVTSTSSSADFTCTVPASWTGTLTFYDNDTTAVYSFKLTDGTTYTATSITAPATMPDVVVYGETVSLFGKLHCTGQACNQVTITTSSGQTCTINGSDVTCANLALVSGSWSGTVTIANQGSNNNKLDTPATAANDCNNSSDTAKTTGTITAGPGDNTAAFSFCAK